MKTPFKTSRCFSGLYEVTNGVRIVTVERRDDLRGWIAAAGWDGHLYTDAVPTKRLAVFNAHRMLHAAACTQAAG
ncbi:MAG: hypothetical protein V3U60_16550 [Gammaproteobacteria bacterium]